jgi:hypothetical protein
MKFAWYYLTPSGKAIYSPYLHNSTVIMAASKCVTLCSEYDK